MLYKDSVKSWCIRRVWRWCWECDRHPFLLFQITQKNMKHFRIVKPKFSNKKTTTFALLQFLVAILFKICYPQKVYVHEIFQNWSSAKVFVRRMTKSFPNFLLICRIFLKIFQIVYYVLEHWVVGCSRSEQGNYNITLYCKL